jgi:hypothetical protein
VRECVKERLTLGGEALLFWRFIDEAFGGAGQLTEDRIPIKGRLWRFRSYLACHTIRITARPSHAQPKQYLRIKRCASRIYRLHLSLGRAPGLLLCLELIH